jgi:tetratricopeptide (TPR) repeat protein
MVVAGAVLLTLGVLAFVPPSWAAPQDKPSYTPAEYNAYTACANDKNAQTRAKCLEDFMAKFPQSSLLPYAYQLAYTTYNEAKNYSKVVEYADKLLALGDKVEITSRVQASYTRALVFEYAYNPRDPNAQELLNRTVQASREGHQILAQWPKPETATDEQFAQTKKGVTLQFHLTAGFAALQLKDYATAIQEYKSALALEPNQPVTSYRLGVAYLQHNSGQQVNGMWAVARAIALKVPNDAQVRSFLRSQLQRYQGGTVCEKESDAQLSELLALAGSSAERPAGYTIPSAAEIDAARKSPEWLNVLRNGGEQARVTWLAMCGLEFPEVYARVFEVAPEEASINLKIYTGTTPEDMEAATGPNCEVKVNSQPLAANFQKDDYFRFAGTLANYTPDPFMLTWDNAKINPEDLPADKSAAPGKRGKRPPAKRVGR